MAALTAALDVNGLGRLPQNRLLAPFIGITALAGLLAGPADWAMGGFWLSLPGLAIALQASLRAVTVLLGVSLFASSVSVSEVTGLFERIGCKGLGFAVGVALNMLPTTREIITTSFHALRLRGGFRRNYLQSLRLLLITVVVSSLRHAEDIVKAAEARAFTPAQARPMPVVWRRSDLAFAAALFAVILAFVLV
jgi:energy-coupling factor transporter transmembrane protein EcfT